MGFLKGPVWHLGVLISDLEGEIDGFDDVPGRLVVLPELLDGSGGSCCGHCGGRERCCCCCCSALETKVRRETAAKERLAESRDDRR